MINPTQTPWSVEAVSDAVRIVTRIPSKDGMSRRPGGVKVILARLNPSQISEAETHANARLMAAAPDLFEACKELVEKGSWSRNDPQTVRARAAIAKAEGRT